MNNILKHHLNDHAEVLNQYMANETTDKVILASMIKRLMLKLFRKQYMEYALNYININGMVEFETKLAEKLGDDLSNEIIQAIKKHLTKKK